MLGITEQIFNLKSPSDDSENTGGRMPTPLSALRQQATQQQTIMPTDQARYAGTPKLKRPVETNRLETGPPKQARLELTAKAPPAKSVQPSKPTGVCLCVCVSTEKAEKALLWLTVVRRTKCGEWSSV